MLSLSRSWPLKSEMAKKHSGSNQDSDKVSEKEKKSDKVKKSGKGKDKKSDTDKEKTSNTGLEKKSDTVKTSDTGKEKKSDTGKEKKSDTGRKKSDTGKEKNSDTGKEKNAAETKSEEVKKSDKRSQELEVPAHVQKRRKQDELPELNRGESKEISVEELLEADQFCPSALPFSLSWEGFHQLKGFYHLTDVETTTILLAMIGPKEAGRKYWSQYKVPLEMFNENGVLLTPKDPAPLKDEAWIYTSKVDKNLENKLQLALPAKRKVGDEETSSTATSAADPFRRFAASCGLADESTSSDDEVPPDHDPFAGLASAPDIEMQISEDENENAAVAEVHGKQPVTLVDQARFTLKVGFGFFVL